MFYNLIIWLLLISSPSKLNRKGITNVIICVKTVNKAEGVIRNVWEKNNKLKYFREVKRYTILWHTGKENEKKRKTIELS